MTKINRWMLCTSLLGAGAALGCAEDGARDGYGTESKGQAFHARAEPVGLSLLFRNGVSEPIELVEHVSRYLDEIDISEQVVTPTDQGIAPLLSGPATAQWDWRGVELVEEQVVPSLDGTFTRERYYRGARWMEKSGRFTVTVHDEHGTRLGAPIRFRTGKDDQWRPGDDGFVRRFVARQLAIGCSAPDDCDNATFVAEALVQARSALHPGRRARRISKHATELRLRWSGDRGTTRSTAVSHVSDAPFGYGFQIELDEVSSPPNGAYYQAGDAVTFRLAFLDGEGTRLHPPGSLPSYAEYASGGTESGLEYLNVQLPTRLYYALKHRESNLMVGISGPVDRLDTPQTIVDPLTFFLPQTQFAFASVDGYSAAIQTVPAAAIIFGGFEDPSLWTTPVSDEVTFTIPDDAQPGTYLAVVKARRSFGGEALQRGATARVQVGQTTSTSFTSETTCGDCHSVPGTGLAETLHGIGDRATCFTCHSSLAIEIDNALDIRVHRIHALSDRYPGNIADCGTCHISPPAGPARGL